MVVRTPAQRILSRVEHLTDVRQGQYGDYISVLFLRSDREGDEAKVWRSLKPQEATQFAIGQQVYLVPAHRNGKNTWDVELLDTSQTSVTNGDGGRDGGRDRPPPSREAIEGYCGSMTRLYAYCHQQAIAAMPGASDAAIQACASSVFIAAQRKFGLA